MASRILITGSTGYLGSKLVDHLVSQGNCEIFGIDVREPANSTSYKKFVKGSVTDRNAMRALFDDAKPDVAIHLAFVVNSTHDSNLEEAVAIDGSRNFLDGCAATDAGKVIFLTSVAAYGAHADNDAPLTEASKIRGIDGYGYSRLKARCDVMAREYMDAHAAQKFILLRPCLFVGPNTDNNFFDVLKYPIVPMISDQTGVRDPDFQFIHEDDMALCIVAAVERDVSGIFNVAGQGVAPFSELVKLYGKRSIALPSWLIYPSTALLWKLHLVTSPPAQLDFIRYPWTMDVSRMRNELYAPRWSSIEAFRLYAKARS
jgi:UDP-glucose 4-epimerase